MAWSMLCMKESILRQLENRLSSRQVLRVVPASCSVTFKTPFLCYGSLADQISLLHLLLTQVGGRYKRPFFQINPHTNGLTSLHAFSTSSLKAFWTTS